MSNLIVFLALTLPSHGHPCGAAPCGHAGGGYVPKYYGCYAYIPADAGGVLAPGLLAGTPGTSVAPYEQKLWDDYLKELDGHERDSMMDVWRQADLEGRRKLLGLLAQLRADIAAKEAEEKLKAEKEKEKAKKPEEKPLSADELKKWDDYLKTLEGDELANAKKAWADSDLVAKRKLLKLAEK